MIYNQPSSSEYKNWQHGFCSCCDDCGECACAYFCTMCYLCQVTSRMNENCCSCFLCGCIPMRTKIRVERKIKGSLPGDFFKFMFCPLCTLVQMGREVKDQRPLI